MTQKFQSFVHAWRRRRIVSIVGNANMVLKSTCSAYKKITSGAFCHYSPLLGGKGSSNLQVAVNALSASFQEVTRQSYSCGPLQLKDEKPGRLNERGALSHCDSGER